MDDLVDEHATFGLVLDHSEPSCAAHHLRAGEHDEHPLGLITLKRPFANVRGSNLKEPGGAQVHGVGPRRVPL